jgi:mono/diheme cytochrome c family protein
MLKIALAVVAIVVAAALWVVGQNLRGESAMDDAAVKSTPELVARGAYLARVGNCAGCHTARGGAPYAGGRAIETPFGSAYASNITPDDETGIGRWSAAHFWRALHNGRSIDGRLLVPAFPYPDMTLVTRADSDALYAYLRSVPAVRQPNRAHALAFPVNSQVALAMWRAVYFTPQNYQSDPAQSAEWNRGDYLVRGLGHCYACHGSRNMFGAIRDPQTAGGSLVPTQHWYAPSLALSAEAGVADWEVAHIAALLRTGVSPRGTAIGPMAEVVYSCTQYLTEPDARAIAVFLKALPPGTPRSGPPPPPPFSKRPIVLGPEHGARLFREYCAGCHGPQGQGAAGIYPALAGNRSVVMEPPINTIRMVLEGGFLPATAGNPRPFGMPPFGHVLNDDETAAVITHIRTAWGNKASPVTPPQVQQARGR